MYVRQVVFNLTLSPHCDTHSLSLLNIAASHAHSQGLRGSWGAGESPRPGSELESVDPRRVRETLGSWFLSMVLYQAQPSGSGGSWHCRIPP